MALGCCDEASGIDGAEEALQANIGSLSGVSGRGLAQGLGDTSTFRWRWPAALNVDRAQQVLQATQRDPKTLAARQGTHEGRWAAGSEVQQIVMWMSRPGRMQGLIGVHQSTTCQVSKVMVVLLAGTTCMPPKGRAVALQRESCRHAWTSRPDWQALNQQGRSCWHATYMQSIVSCLLVKQ